MTRDEFAATAHKHRKAFISQACLYVDDRTLAADLVAAATEKCLRVAGKITRAGFNKYTFDTIRNTCLDYLELHRHAHEQPLWVDEEGQPIDAGGADPTDDVRIDIDRALAALPDRVRSVAVKVYCDELTQPEIAQQMGCTQKHVSKLLGEANALLRETLAAYGSLLHARS